jgi:hypothetical protein
MSIRTLVLFPLAVVLAGSAAAAVAQNFGSISSLPPAPVAPPPAVSTAPAAAPAAPARASAGVSAMAFSSVSSIDTGGDSNAAGSGPVLPQAGPVMADRILVEKGARRLLLLNNGNVIATYPVRLGLSPKGPKLYEGDFRTPEGIYYLSRRNPNSEYFLSVEISYPNEADRARAKAEGLRPGGLIMIHGQPNAPRRPPEYYARRDWTDGCIAVRNADMADIWQRTRVGIPIEIRP